MMGGVGQRGTGEGRGEDWLVKPSGRRPSRAAEAFPWHRKDPSCPEWGSHLRTLSDDTPGIGAQPRDGAWRGGGDQGSAQLPQLTPGSPSLPPKTSWDWAWITRHLQCSESPWQPPDLAHRPPGWNSPDVVSVGVPWGPHHPPPSPPARPNKEEPGLKGPALSLSAAGDPDVPLRACPTSLPS